MKFGFYVLGIKGYFALKEFEREFGIDSIAFVVGARDPRVKNDWYSETVELCSTNGIVFHTRRDANEELLPDANFRFAIGWRWMIKNSSGLIVFHDSLLPKYRGFSPLVNMLVEGATEIGVTALLASNEYDKGEIVYQKKKSIEYPKKISNAIDEIIPFYEQLVVETARDILSFGRLKSFPQDEKAASYSVWRDENDYFIDWSSSAERIIRFVDAVGFPYDGAATFLNGEVIRIFNVESFQDVAVENRTACVGKVIFFDDSFPVIVCGSGLLKITDLRRRDGNSLVGLVPFRSRMEANN